MPDTNRRLDILVPHWQETASEMEPLLDSIKLQRSVDFSQVGVIIAFDGPDAKELPLDEWRERYPFAIEDVHPEKGGVSHARNAALDASKADYIQYSDADDCLLDVCGMYIIFREMDMSPNQRDIAMFAIPKEEQAPGFDFLISNFREETKDPNGNLIYVPHEMDSTFVHGKVARRQWLIDNDIRFCDSVRIHEDSCWVTTCRAVAKPYRSKYNPTPYVLWCWRNGSVCRSEKYILRTMPDLLMSNEVLVDGLIKRGLSDQAARYFVMVTWESYFTLNKAEWRESENKEYFDTLECKFASYFRRRRDLWDSVGEHEKVVISQSVRQRQVMEGMLMEALTIDQWLDRILEKYPEETQDIA